MRPRIAPLLAAAALAALAVLAPAPRAGAAEPYDSQLAETLVDPGPGFTEITDPGDPGRSGPLDAARMEELDVRLPADQRDALLGGAVRGFADPTNRVIEVAYALVDGEHARSALTALPAIGQPIDMPGIPGATARGTDAPTPVAYAAFVLGSRAYVVVVGGPDPGHALLQDTALQVVNTAAELLAGGLATDMGGGDLDAPGPAAATPADESLGGRIHRALSDNEVRLALAGVAALLLYLLARRSRPVPRETPTNPIARNAGHAWRQAGGGWAGDPGTAYARSASHTERPVVPLGGPVAGADAAWTVDSGWGERHVGWGDEPAAAPPSAGAPLPAPTAVAPTAVAPTPPPLPAAGGLVAGPVSDEVVPPLPVRRPGGTARREAAPIFQASATDEPGDTSPGAR